MKYYCADSKGVLACKTFAECTKAGECAMANLKPIVTGMDLAAPDEDKSVRSAIVVRERPKLRIYKTRFRTPKPWRLFVPGMEEPLCYWTWQAAILKARLLLEIRGSDWKYAPRVPAGTFEKPARIVPDLSGRFKL